MLDERKANKANKEAYKNHFHVLSLLFFAFPPIIDQPIAHPQITESIVIGPQEVRHAPLGMRLAGPLPRPGPVHRPALALEPRWR